MYKYCNRFDALIETSCVVLTLELFVAVQTQWINSFLSSVKSHALLRQAHTLVKYPTGAGLWMNGNTQTWWTDRHRFLTR